MLTCDADKPALGGARRMASRVTFGMEPHHRQIGRIARAAPAPLRPRAAARVARTSDLPVLPARSGAPAAGARPVARGASRGQVSLPNCPPRSAPPQGVPTELPTTQRTLVCDRPAVRFRTQIQEHPGTNTLARAPPRPRRRCSRRVGAAACVHSVRDTRSNTLPRARETGTCSRGATLSAAPLRSCMRASVLRSGLTSVRCGRASRLRWPAQRAVRANDVATLASAPWRHTPLRADACGTAALLPRRRRRVRSAAAPCRCLCLTLPSARTIAPPTTSRLRRPRGHTAAACRSALVPFSHQRQFTRALCATRAWSAPSQACATSA